MKISIQFKPEDQMRYPTLGDWWWEAGGLHIAAAIDHGEDRAFLVALHEFVEAWLCRRGGVSEDEVTAFDLSFIAEGHAAGEEPGDDPRAPYRLQHRKAMLIEHLMASFLDLNDYGQIR